MTVLQVHLALDALDPRAQARTWGALLDRPVVEDGGSALLPATETQVGLRFDPSRTPGAGQNRVHLHLTCTDEDDQQRLVARVLELGGRHVDVGQRPEEGHVVLADPEGNELCVLEPGTAFVAGCGLLGEVTSPGSRELGVWWSEVLGWPLVWDSDGETAVQSPAGGTKLSWDGPPVPPRDGPDRQRIDLTVDDPAAEAERLVGLGGRHLGTGEDGTVRVADPDGGTVVLRRG